MDFVNTAHRNTPANRMPSSLVNVTSSVLLELVPALPVVAAPNGDKHLSLAALTAIYARRLIPVAVPVVYDTEVGAASVDPRKFGQLDEAVRALKLAGTFSAEPSTLAAFVARLALANLPPAVCLLNATDLVANQAHRANTHANLHWSDSITFGQLKGADGQLKPYADFVNLVGDHIGTAERVLDGKNRWSTIFKLMDTHVRDHEGLPPAAAPADAAAAADGAAADPPFLPTSPDDGEILDGIGQWLDYSALPSSLFALATDRRDARRELRHRIKYEESPALVIRERYNSFISCFPHLFKILNGLGIAEMTNTAELIAARLQAPPLTSVATYHSLERTVASLTYALDSGGGAALLSPNERANRVIELGEQARTRGSAAASTVVMANSSSTASAAAASTDVRGAGAKCFESMHGAALSAFVAEFSNELHAALNAVDATTGVSALGSAESTRVLAIVMKARRVPYWQFVLREKSSCPLDIFKTIDPFRDDFLKYLSERVSVNASGAITHAMEGFTLDADFVTKLRSCQWDKIDFYGNLRGKIDQHKDQKHVPVKWPDGVFVSGDRVRLLKEDGDKLFNALGYRKKHADGWWGKLETLQVFLDDGCPPGCFPEIELARAFQHIIEDAQRAAQRAMNSGPDASFPDFGTADGTWTGILVRLTAAADAERGRALLRRETRSSRYDDGAVAAARARSPSPTVTYDLDADALPSAAPAPKKVRMSAGSTVTIRDGTGSLAHLVKKFNASSIEMQFEQKDGSVSPNVWAFPHAEVKKAVRKTEGTDAKCMVCACVKSDHNRHKYCNMASNTGHESRNAAMHTFVGQPWELIRGRML